MNESLLKQIELLKSQKSEMVSLLISLSNINSGSDNLLGLTAMAKAVEKAFQPLEGKISKVELPPRKKIGASGELIEIKTGHALHIIKRPSAKRRVLLAGHLDTVFSTKSDFQEAKYCSEEIIQGPGVADMKGGIVIMLKALEAFERLKVEGIGWEVLMTPDEEVGSQSSESLLISAAKRCDIGLIFEPSFPDGALVSGRKGSMNFTVVAKGKAAHVGREFHLGKNAIVALARFIILVEALNKDEGISINAGQIEGGGPVNIVADLAICRFNIRFIDSEKLIKIRQKLAIFLQEISSEGITLQLYEETLRPPKPFTEKTKQLFDELKECGEALDIPISWRESGGVCDGNILSGAGLATIDTLGAIGGNIHTKEEHLLVNSLPERAILTFLFLAKIAGVPP